VQPDPPDPLAPKAQRVIPGLLVPMVRPGLKVPQDPKATRALQAIPGPMEELGQSEILARKAKPVRPAMRATMGQLAQLVRPVTKVRSELRAQRV
jgi:hypothetical protein